MTASHGEGYTEAEEHITLHGLGGFVPSAKKLGGWIRSCWRGFVSNLAKKIGLGRVLGYSWRCSNAPNRNVSQTETIII
jgi:hypothetical protein